MAPRLPRREESLVRAPMIRKCDSLFDLIRDATLVRIAPRAVARPGAEIWAQLELMLPGAMKDRVALPEGSR